MSSTAVRAVVFTVLIPGTVTLLVPALIYGAFGTAPETLGYFRLLGPVLILAGLFGYIRSVAEFVLKGLGTPAPWFIRRLRSVIGEEPQILVRSSIYERVRNPMYVSVLLILAGEALLLASPALLLYALGAAVFFHAAVVLIEEPHLRQKQGAAFEEYCRKVPRWIPRVRPPARGVDWW